MRIGIAALTVVAAALMLVGAACGPQPASGAGSTQPTATPTQAAPSSQPTAAPTQAAPSSQPTAAPTQAALSSQPTVAPTQAALPVQSTVAPTPAASSTPPTATPTPTAPATPPTATPTLAAPSAQPTAVPTQTARPDDQTRVRVPVKSVSPSPTAEPGLTRVQVPAYVESASIVVSGGSAELVIVTGQPSACYEFGGYELDESSMPRIVLEVFNTKYTNVACAQVYSSTETRIPLEQTIEPCKDYTVEINGGERRMQAVEQGKRCGSTRAVKPGSTPRASTESRV